MKVEGAFPCIGRDFLVTLEDDELSELCKCCRSSGWSPSSENMADMLRLVIWRGLEESLEDIETVEALAREHGED